VFNQGLTNFIFALMDVRRLSKQVVGHS